MPERTDLQFVNGRVVPKPQMHSEKPLPPVDGSDLLQTDAWGESWKKQAGDPDNAINALADSQAAMSRAFRGFMEVRAHPSPHQTQAQHLDTLAKDYSTAIKRLADQNDRAVKRAGERLAEIESQFREHVGWSERDAQELRSVVRGMGEKDRSEFVNAAIKNGDGQALAAILGGHPSLSGISAEAQAGYRARAMSEHVPQLLNLERTITKAREATREAFLQLLDREDAVTAAKVREEYAEKARAAHEARQRASFDEFGAV